MKLSHLSKCFCINVYRCVVSPPLKLQNYNWPRKLTREAKTMMKIVGANLWMFFVLFFFAKNVFMNPRFEHWTSPLADLFDFMSLLLCVYKSKMVLGGGESVLSSPQVSSRCLPTTIRSVHFIFLMWFSDSKTSQVSCQSSLTEELMPLRCLEQDATIIHHNTSHHNIEITPPPPFPSHTHTKVGWLGSNPVPCGQEEGRLSPYL